MTHPVFFVERDTRKRQLGTCFWKKHRVIAVPFSLQQLLLSRRGKSETKAHHKVYPVSQIRIRTVNSAAIGCGAYFTEPPLCPRKNPRFKSLQILKTLLLS
jgi:hypothetical protein